MKKSILLLMLVLTICFASSAFALFNVSVLTPADNTISSTANLNVTFNVTLDTGDISNCSMMTNVSGAWARSHTNDSDDYVANTSTSYINYTFSTDGNYKVGIECVDSTGTANYSNNITYIYDSTKPVIASYASNSNITSTTAKWWPSATVFLNFSATELHQKSANFSITNSTGDSIQNSSMNYDGTGYYNMTFVSTYDSNYTINITLWDNASNSNWTAIVIRIDTTYPQIINSTGNVANNTIQDSVNWIYYNLTQSDTNYANTTFYLYNWSKDLVNSTVYTTASTTAINWTGLPYGRYYYNATIVDLAGNKNSTGTYQTYLYKIESGLNASAGTNFSAVTNWSAVAVSLVTSTINVTFTNNQDLTASSLDFDTYTTFGTESVYIGTSQLGLTGQAKVKISGLTYSQKPTILKDGGACSECTDITYSGGVLSFTTSGFSTYTLYNNDGSGGHVTGGGGGGVSGNGAYCGNGVCDATYIGENSNTCPQDCKPVLGNTVMGNVNQVAGTGSLSSTHPTIDSDSDGLTDYQESNIFFTNPRKQDSDDDGVSDYIEAKQGSTPGKGTTGTTRTSVNQVAGTEWYKDPMTLTITSICLVALLGSVGFIIYRKRKNPYI